MLANKSSVDNAGIAVLSEEETKKYLTPFAFKMDNSLFGLPLASPAKRGIALLIDLSMIAVLSGTSGNILTLTIAVTLYYLGNKKRAQKLGKVKGYKRRAIMRFIAGFMLFILILTTLPDLLDFSDKRKGSSGGSTVDESLSVVKSLALSGTVMSTMKAIAESDCHEFTCWQTELNSIAVHIARISYESDIKIPKVQRDDIFADIGSEIELSLNEQQLLIESMQDSFDQELSRLAVENRGVQQGKSALKSIEENINIDEVSPVVLGSAENIADTEKTQEEKSNRPVYSIIELVKGIIEDLGLGFGWATFYFTAFISIGKGQTIGKKLLGIKVLQLDGTPLSLWDSFGRYGGYGAGIATGLLGFIQIYWDPNKQAIHDQISATVVIDINKMRLSQKALQDNQSTA